jgi:hypothetical protein
MLARAAQPFILTHEKFMLMTNQQQNEVLIKMMETIVELEQNHLNKNRSVTYHQEKLQKLKNLYIKIQSLIISEAHAQIDENTFIAFADEFNKALSEKDSNDKCIYAGWVSRMKPMPFREQDRTVNKQVCVHPKKLDSTDELSKSYRKVLDRCKENEIACQPAIFGFKNASNPICVKVHLFDEVQNASAACKKEATKDPGSAEFNERFSKLKSIISKGNVTSNKALETMYGNLAKACLCRSDGVKTLNENYKNYMQPHQTCYGLLSTLKQVLLEKECLPPALVEKEEFKFLEKIKDNLSIREADSSDPKKLARPWEDYQDFIKDYEAANFCKDPVPVKELICKADCVLKDSKIECKLTDSETQKEIIPEATPVFKSGEEIQIIEKQTKRITICKIDVKEEPKKAVYICAPECKFTTAPAVKRECQLKINKDDQLVENLKPEISVFSDAVVDKAAIFKTKLKTENGLEEIICNIPAQSSDKPTPEEPKKKERKCSAKCEKKEKKISCTELSILEDEKSLPGVTFQQSEFEESQVKDNKVSVEYKLGEDIQKITCELQISSPSNNEPEKPKLSLKLKIDETTSTSRTVSALINDKAEIPAEHEIQWTRKDTGSLKFDAEKPAEKTSAIPDNNGSSRPEEKVSTSVVSKGIKTTQPRKSAVYKICASLIDKEKKSAGEKCEDIPATESKAPAPQGNGRNLPPPPQIQFRQGTGTGYGGSL